MNKNSNVCYPVFFTTTNDVSEYNVLVEVPDLEIVTEGKTLNDAINMARDAIGDKCVILKKERGILPKPSTVNNLNVANGVFAGKGTTIISYVDANLETYKKMMDTKTVRRNVTLPSWLNYKAEQAGLNVSRVLREALIETLELSKDNLNE